MKRVENEIQFTWQGDKVLLWKLVGGDKTFRLDYDISEDDLVIDLGGYEGDWASKIYDKYNCNIFVFEPVDEFHQAIKNKFIKEQKIKVFNCGLGPVTKKEDIYLSEDASSIINQNGTKKSIDIENIKTFLQNHKITKVKLLKINIEGAEYELLEYMGQNNLFEIFENIQIQFHKYISDYKNRRDTISTNLSKTHTLTYNFDMVWENWKLK